MHGVVRYLDTSWGLITPGWVTWVRVSDIRPETPRDPIRITEDVSRREAPAPKEATASDRQLLVDLGRQLRFPDIIAATTLQPDMVMMSRAKKQVVLLELSDPWENRMEEAQVRKKAKYADLVA
ncbi:hypothetical protein SRHO_G00295170 [Serrasalmus rhombeus]